MGTSQAIWNWLTARGFHGTRRRARSTPRHTFRRPRFERLESRSLLTATLVGTVWHDLNSDGVQTGGEPGLQYAVAELFNSANGTIGDADDVSLGTRITDSAGNYQFTGLAAGVNHYVVIRPPVGLAFTVQDTGPDATDSDVGSTGVSAMFAPVDLSAADLDAGLTGAAPAFGWAAGIARGWGESVTVDAAGYTYMTGDFDSTADFDPGPGAYDLTSLGSNDAYVAKYTAGGALVWARLVGGVDSGRGQDLAVDSTGNVFVSGYFMGTADFDPGAGVANLTSAHGRDVFILKLDASGNYQWARQVLGTGDDYCFGVALDAADSILLTGHFSGTADFDPGAGVANLTSAGWWDAFILKLDSDGNYQWARRVGGSMDDFGWDVAVDGLGNALVTGRFRNTVDFDPGVGVANLTSASANLSDVFVLKLDAAGSYAWAKRVGDFGEDVGYGVAVDASGNVLVTGDFYGTADFDPGAGVANLTSAGNGDAFILKLDSDGNYQWARRVGGTTRDIGYGVAVDTGGNVLVTGYFTGTADFDPGPGIANFTSVGTYTSDIFVLKLGVAGNYLWAVTAGSYGDERGEAVVVDAGGNIVVTGVFVNADFDPGPGNYDLVGSSFVWRFAPASFLPATVTGVFVRGTGDASGTGNDEWLAAYLGHLGTQGLGDAVLGYRVSVGADQLDTLPWTNVDTVSIRFSEGVTVTSGHLQLLGAAEGPAVPAVANFNYNASTFTATWQFAAPLPANKYLLHFATGVVVGLDTFALDGEWTDSVSTTSGDALAGGAFSFRMNVVPGDTNGDTATTQSVTNADVLLTRQALSTDTSAGATYLYRRDVNGSGAITNADVLSVKQRLQTTLFDFSDPVPPPPGESSPAGGASLSGGTPGDGFFAPLGASDETGTSGPVDPAAWDAAILATYGQTKKDEQP